MHPETARRGRLLYVALAFLGLDLPPAAQPSGLRALHAWLETWHGIGHVVHGLARHDRDLSLTRYRDRWGATIFVTGREHASCRLRVADDAVGAVRQAAFQALHRGDSHRAR
jgi:hypothetical protein